MKGLLLMIACGLAGCQVYARDSAFVDEPVILKTATGNIVGTLSMPADSINIPVALIIAGSGPTDRNGNAPGVINNSLKLLADQLARHGIAAVRFDKRGVGESASSMKNESSLLFDTYITDVTEWLHLLKADRRFKAVYVVGHSEGSLIALASASKDVSGLVSIAGAGRSADKILKTQLGSQPKVVKDACYAIIDSLANGQLVSSVSPMLNALFRPSIQPYLINWFHYDPAVQIKKCKIPVLILQGTNDLQVSVEDAKILSAANPAAKLVLIDSMNHVMKTTGMDRAENLAAYTDPALPVSPKLVQTIIEFIRPGVFRE